MEKCKEEETFHENYRGFLSFYSNFNKKKIGGMANGVAASYPFRNF